MAKREDRSAGKQLLLEASRSEIHGAGGPRTGSSTVSSGTAKEPALLLAPRKEASPNEPTGTPSNAESRAEGQEAHLPSKAGKTRSAKRTALLAGSVLAVAAAGSAGGLYWDCSSHFESTDDAFIAARQFPIAPRVSGYIVAVPVTDNQHVKAGDVIARIDDRDYRVALEQAEAQVAASRANVGHIDAQMDVQQAQIAAAQAQVDQAQAALTFAQQAARFEELVKKGAGTVQNAQQSASQLNQQQAAVESAQATLKLAERQVETLKAQRAAAAANLAQAEAQRDQAQLNLSYTTVTAAQDGRVVNLSAGVGAFAPPGAALATFVPGQIWVTANFKETQLDHMLPGQPATIRVDAFPDHDFRGHVVSVQPGSGTAFSLLPPENATGNYVKIVQRVPVKIALDNPSPDVALGPGMSVAPTVRIDPEPSLYHRLKERVAEFAGQGHERLVSMK